MPARLLLRKQILSAWENTITRHYEDCLINSESSLQASFWCHLMEAFSNGPRRTFIEPIIKSDRSTVSKNRFPDLIVCNSRSVIAVVELKYTPRVGPKTKKDLKTLNWIAENKKDLFVVNDRFLGVASKQRRYCFAERIIYVWASVHKKQSVDLEPKSLVLGSKLKNSFMMVHCRTSDGAKPQTGCSYG